MRLARECPDIIEKFSGPYGCDFGRPLTVQIDFFSIHSELCKSADIVGYISAVRHLSRERNDH
jgi:hypothetical protein